MQRFGPVHRFEIGPASDADRPDMKIEVILAAAFGLCDEHRSSDRAE
jgi:hypothetical protein